MSGGVPLLDSAVPLDDRRLAVLENVRAAELASILGLPSDDPLDAKRRARVVATYPEMMAQPEAVIATWRGSKEALTEVAGWIVALPVERVCMVGAGDSLAVMIAARLALETTLCVPCEAVQSLEFAYYASQRVGPRTVVLALSSSGETTSTVEAALIAQNRGAMTVALTNTPGSTLDRESAATLLLKATRVGWPTQSSTTALALLLHLAAKVGVLRSEPSAAVLASELDHIPELMRETLHRGEAFAQEIAAREVDGQMYLFSGGGPNLASAVVGAAKVKECTPNHALAIQVEEYHHYNSQKADEPLWLLAPSGPSVRRARETASEARRFGGRAYAVTSDGESAFDDAADAVLHLPVVSECLSPMLHFLPAQQIGYYLAMAKFAAAEAASSE